MKRLTRKIALSPRVGSAVECSSHQGAGTRTKLEEFDAGIGSSPIPDRSVLLSLAQDLPAVWNAATADMRLKQRIMRILIQEIVADVYEATSEVVLLIHWAGGRHSELRVKKNHLGHVTP